MALLHVFASNLKHYRNERGISQEAFAEKCELHRTYISAVERERRNISIVNVERIADALDVPAYWLFIDRDEPAPPPKSNGAGQDHPFTRYALDQKG